MLRLDRCSYAEKLSDSIQSLKTAVMAHFSEYMTRHNVSKEEGMSRLAQINTCLLSGLSNGPCLQSI